MPAGQAHETQSFQPKHIYKLTVTAPVDIWTPDVDAAQTTAFQLAEAFLPGPDEPGDGTDPLTIERFRIDPEAPITDISVFAGEQQGLPQHVHVGFMCVPNQDGSVVLQFKHHNLYEGHQELRSMLADALSGSAGVLLAPERFLSLHFATGATALGYLGAHNFPLRDGPLEHAARRQAFAALTEYVGSASTELLDIAGRRAPHLAADITALQANDTLNEQAKNYRLKSLPLKAYMDLTIEDARKIYLNDVRALARTLRKGQDEYGVSD